MYCVRVYCDERIHLHCAYLSRHTCLDQESNQENLGYLIGRTVHVLNLWFS